MNGPRDRKPSRWSPVVFLWMSSLCLSFSILVLHVSGCASSSESVTSQSDSAVSQNQPKAQQSKTSRHGKSIQSQSVPDSPRSIQQDKKSVLADVPDSDGEQPQKTKKKKPARKPPSGEAVLPPEPSKPPAVGGSGG